jgi:biotin-dependent carboxylase-like uncharacterized protein
MDSHLLILSAGFYTSIQDLGRKKYRSYGVPISGAMDKYSMILANNLLGNETGMPVMEMTLTGAKIMFENDTLFVITGADLSPELNGEPLEINMVYPAHFGDVLKFGKRNYGVRTYLGVKGGFKTERILDSYSYFEGITSKFRIEKGDRLSIASCDRNPEHSSAKVKIKKEHFKTDWLYVTKGPEFDLLTKKQTDLLFKKSFEIDTLNNRMGYQLKTLFPPANKKEIITSVLIPGTVQLTPSGKLIIMMRDCPTTGGYPRILQLTDEAINRLAQLETGDTFTFNLENVFSFLRRLASRFTD